MCHTEIPNCCRDVDDPFENEENGEWFYPDGQVSGYISFLRIELSIDLY